MDISGAAQAASVVAVAVVSADLAGVVLAAAALAAAGKEGELKIEKMGYSKWIGGAIGWALGGPIGGMLGYALGSAAGRSAGSVPNQQAGGRRHTGGGDFAAALIVLSAAVMRADEKVLRSELDYVKRFFNNNFPPEQAEKMLLTLREVLNQQQNTRAICMQIRTYMEHSKRLLLLQYLYGIAQSDGDVDLREVEEIRRMAMWMGISEKDRLSIEASFHTDVASHFAVLEIEESASDAEVKKSYRRMALKFHPDKVRDMGEEYQKQARERFLRINDAYEAIKSQRGMK
jgi:DnaJ like chaperone protein